MSRGIASQLRTALAFTLAGTVLVVSSPATPAATAAANAPAESRGNNAKFTSDFDTASCTWSSQGRNLFFVLEPNHRLVLRGREGREDVELIITVKSETRTLAGVETRLVEERETVGGELAEVSRNYFAFCTQTNTAFYFGEDVDFYENGQIANHDGSWLAGQNGARPGVQMPGLVLLGSRYFQEIAPPIALDRAEIVSLSEVVDTPSGRFTGALKTEETSGLEAGKEFKYYARGIGLVSDGNLKLVSHGTI